MLEIKNVSVRFSANSDVQAVEDVSLTLPEGGKMALVGETGSGKSVLLLAILRLLPDSARTEGSVLLDGVNIWELPRRELCRLRGGVISYVPQAGGSCMNPLMKVGFQVGEPLMEHKGLKKKEAVARSIELMRRFNMGSGELAAAYPHTFSGGMRQRAMVAMGISAGARIVLADEPPKGLDEKRVALVAEALSCLEQETLLCVTHDLLFAGKISRQICVLYAAQQVELGRTEEILYDPLHPYTRDMVRAIPENGMEVDRAGFAPPHTGYAGAGCRYKHRCPHRSAACDRMPPLMEVGERKVRCWLYADAGSAADKSV